MAVNGNEKGQDAHCVMERSIINPQCELQFGFMSLLELPNVTKFQMCLDSQSIGQKHARGQLENMECYSPSLVDTDIEKGKLDTTISGDGAVGNTKTEDSLSREISFHVGGKFMEFLMNHGLEVPKFISRDKFIGERVNDTPTNKLRKYKRSVSFNSRRVVLLSSVLSIMGTIILIFLTLRVRQLSDAAANT